MYNKPMRNLYGARTVEKVGNSFDGIKMWFSKAYRIGVLMANGAYLLSERRRLFGKLGEEVYARIARGELKSPELEPLVHQLDRLTKKVEIEEILIRNLRYGKPARAGNADPSANSSTSPSSP